MLHQRAVKNFIENIFHSIKLGLHLLDLDSQRLKVSKDVVLLFDFFGGKRNLGAVDSGHLILTDILFDLSDFLRHLELHFLELLD